MDRESCLRWFHNKGEYLNKYRKKFPDIFFTTSGYEHTGALSGGPVDATDLRGSLQNYTPIDISKLKPGIHHKQYLICRQLTRPFKVFTVSSLVESLPVSDALEEEDNTKLLVLENYMMPNTGVMEDCSFALPMDSILLVLEPACKFKKFEENIVVGSIYVSNPTHLVRLNDIPEEKLPHLQTLEQQETLIEWLKNPTFHVDFTWLEKNSLQKYHEYGNFAFEDQQDYAKAAAYYTKYLELASIIEVDTLSTAKVWSNRAQSMLYLGENLLAVRDTEEALKLLDKLSGEERDRALAKTAFRLARALSNLQAFEKALEVMEKYANVLQLGGEPVEKLLLDLHSVTTPTLEYDLEQMVHQHETARANKKELVNFMLPNFVHTGVKVEDGFVASVDFTPGTLIVVEKGVVGSTPLSTVPQPAIHKNEKTNQIDTWDEITLQAKILQQMLYPGTRGGCAMKALLDNNEVDVQQVHDVLKMVTFNTFSTLQENSSGPSPTGAPDRMALGFYGMTAIFNHSCTPNCHYTIMGDLILVHTICPVQAGEELTLWFKTAHAVHYMDCDDLSYWGIKCSCELCTANARCPEAFKEGRRILKEAYAKGPTQEHITQMRRLQPKLEVEGQFPQLAILLLLLNKVTKEATDKVRIMEEILSVCDPDTKYGYTLPIPPALIFMELASFKKMISGHNPESVAKTESKVIEHMKRRAAGSEVLFLAIFRWLIKPKE